MARVLVVLAGGDLVRGALRAAVGLVLVIAVAAVSAVVGVTALLSAAAGVRPALPPPAAPPAAGVPAVVPGAPDAAVVAVAGRFLGTMYAWGGASPATGFDCSGLVQWSYRQVGVDLPRTAQQQYDATVRVGRDQLRAGDLVFFQICCQPPDTVTHVGLYVGGGQMVHAPTEGQVVRVESIDTPFWRGHFAGAGRPLQPPGGGR